MIPTTLDTDHWRAMEARSPTWSRLLAEHAGAALRTVAEARERTTVYPAPENVFRAFELTPFESVRAVILGADPYYNGHAVGLAFSTRPGVKTPRSLRNIYKELERSAPRCTDCFGGGHRGSETCWTCTGTGNLWKWRTPTHGDLTAWAERGVLLCNTSLSVEAGKPGSHAGIWKGVTKALLSNLWINRTGIVWMVWGHAAQQMVVPFRDDLHIIKDSGNRWEQRGHLILTAPHPADRRKGIVGSDCFVEANRWIETKGLSPIDWGVDP